jgi:hypothetical protein|tara:strand:- start:49 stop:486 length:438 start_codon:yes stop_codon:yes gene_type:complete
MKTNPERVLKLILQINGAVMATALVAVFMSHDQMAAIHQWLGLGKFPEGIIVDYLARSLSAFYALMGVLYIVLARDIRAYATIITFMAWASICFGVATIIIDLQLGFPAWWTWGEGPFIIAYGAVVLWLQRKVKKTPEEVADDIS